MNDRHGHSLLICPTFQVRTASGRSVIRGGGQCRPGGRHQPWRRHREPGQTLGPRRRAARGAAGRGEARPARGRDRAHLRWFPPRHHGAAGALAVPTAAGGGDARDVARDHRGATPLPTGRDRLRPPARAPARAIRHPHPDAALGRLPHRLPPGRRHLVHLAADSRRPAGVAPLPPGAAGDRGTAGRRSRAGLASGRAGTRVRTRLRAIREQERRPGARRLGDPARPGRGAATRRRGTAHGGPRPARVVPGGAGPGGPGVRVPLAHRCRVQASLRVGLRRRLPLRLRRLRPPRRGGDAPRDPRRRHARPGPARGDRWPGHGDGRLGREGAGPCCPRARRRGDEERERARAHAAGFTWSRMAGEVRAALAACVG